MYLDWTTLRPGDLPDPLDDIALHGGEELLDRLAQMGVDLPMDVPADKLGVAIAWFLRDTLGGNVLHVPVLHDLERGARDRAIYTAHTEDGLGVGQLARRFEVSRRVVKRVLDRMSPEPPAPAPRRSRPSVPPLPSLFEPPTED